MSAASGKLPPVPPAQQWPRGPRNLLHDAAGDGSIEATVSILSMGSIDINQGEPKGWTPLMVAARNGKSPVVRILLNKGANVSIAAHGDCTALHTSAQHGHLAVTKMLMEAGAGLEAVESVGATPLCLAAHGGHWEVMRALIEAGANPDSRSPNGDTPLFVAAHEGHVQAIRELLRAKADPLLTKGIQTPTFVMHTVPLDSAARRGNSDAVHELIQQVGIEGCGGPSGGELALQFAADGGHIDVMVMLADVGVVDTCCSALVAAAAVGHEGPVKFLLQQHKKNITTGEGAYVNSRGRSGHTPLLASISSCSPRVGRMLVDAGADTTSTISAKDTRGGDMDITPLGFTLYCRLSMVRGKGATEEKLHRLESIRRLLLQVAAVHAVSWLWPRDVPAIGRAAEGTRKTKVTSTSLTVRLLILRRRTRRRGVLLAALFRYSRKL